MKVKANISEHFGGSNVNHGTITNGGVLNGSTERIFNSAAFPTPDPAVISFTSDYVVTSHRGVLTTRVVYLFDVVRAVTSALHRIDPNASTGIFNGATGVLYGSDQLDFQAFTVEGALVGEICFAS